MIHALEYVWEAGAQIIDLINFGADSKISCIGNVYLDWHFHRAIIGFSPNTNVRFSAYNSKDLKTFFANLEF